MPPEVLDRVFEPFFTTKSPGKGTGLGLASVRALLERVGGVVTVESAVGEGTEVRLRLPRVEQVLVSPSPAPVVARSRPCAVLLVEDDPALRRGLRRVLSRDGHQVTEAWDERSARAAWTPEARFELLITDAVMPDSDTDALIASFCAAWPDAPVILCSGWTEDHALIERLRQREVTFLPKPVLPEALRAAIAAAQAGSAHELPSRSSGS